MVFKENKVMWGEISPEDVQTYGLYELRTWQCATLPIRHLVNQDADDGITIDIIISSLYRNTCNRQYCGKFFDAGNWYNITLLVDENAGGSFMLTPCSTPMMEREALVDYYRRMIQGLPLASDNLR